MSLLHAFAVQMLASLDSLATATKIGGDHEDAMHEFQRTFRAAAVEEEGVQCIVAPDIEGLAVLLADAKGDVNQATLQEVLTSKNWEASKSFTWAEMCELK